MSLYLQSGGRVNEFFGRNLPLPRLAPAYPQLALFGATGSPMEYWNDGIVEWWGILPAGNWVRLAQLAWASRRRQVCPPIRNPQSAIRNREIGFVSHDLFSHRLLPTDY
jgi:hypothetical protein